MFVFHRRAAARVFVCVFVVALPVEVLRVLFLGFCFGFYYFLWRVLLPKFGFDFSRRAVSQALMESSLVPLGHRLECRVFYLDTVIPPASMDQLILVGTVDVFG